MEIKSVYNYKNVCDAIISKFNPYQVLGISEDTPSEVILKMWNRYKVRNIHSQVKRAFDMLVVPANRFVYDEMMKYVNEYGIECVYDFRAAVDNKLREHIARKEDDIIYNTRIEFQRNLDFCKNRRTIDNPNTGSKLIEHVARYVRNDEGFWFYSKDNKGQDRNIIDIYKIDGKYLYYINEQGMDYFIESRYLYLDFNKPTKFNGVICRLSDVACRIKGNLLGLYTEINNMDPKIMIKYEYFRNTVGNQYDDERDGLLLRVVDINERHVYPLCELKHDRTGSVEKVYSTMMDYENYFIEGNKVSEEDKNMLIKDANNINSLDASEIIGRKLI